MGSGSVPGFRPSVNGLHFANRFPPGPALRLRLPWLGLIGIGNAALGLCGGMVFLTRDLLTLHRPPPPRRTPPPGGSPLFRYLVRRQIASFVLGLSVLRYLWWMALPDQNQGRRRSIAWQSAVGQWPAVRAELDAGRPVALGLIRAKARTPFAFGRIAVNHQVLAYAYTLDEAAQQLRLSVYDPNHPDRDDIAIAVDLADPSTVAAIHYSTGESVRGFFVTPYRPAAPSRALAAQAPD